MNQQNQKISNPQTPVPTTSEMNDRDFVNELLTTEKYMTTAYCTALHEFSHESLYQDIQSIFDESQKRKENCMTSCSNMDGILLKRRMPRSRKESYQKFQQTIQQRVSIPAITLSVKGIRCSFGHLSFLCKIN